MQIPHFRRLRTAQRFASSAPAPLANFPRYLRSARPPRLPINPMQGDYCLADTVTMLIMCRKTRRFSMCDRVFVVGIEGRVV